MIDSEKLNMLKIQPVGNGLIDLICPLENIDDFIDACNSERIEIKGFTWWCHVTDGHIPCGMGGPKSRYFDGWFSEIRMGDVHKLKDNETYRGYFRNIWPCEDNYHECWWPAFWLEE